MKVHHFVFFSSFLRNMAMDYVSIAMTIENLIIIVAYPLILRLSCKTQENSTFLKNGKTVILVIIRNFSRSRMAKWTSPLESSREI